MTARAVFVFIVSLSFYGWSFLLRSFHMLYNKREPVLQIFYLFYFLRCYSRDATIFTIVWEFPAKILFGRRYRAISDLTLRNWTLSQCITKLNPSLIPRFVPSRLCSNSWQWHFCYYQHATHQYAGWTLDHDCKFPTRNKFCRLFWMYSFLKQHYKHIMPTPLQSHSSVCGFYTIYATFHLFKFRQEARSSRW